MGFFAVGVVVVVVVAESHYHDDIRLTLLCMRRRSFVGDKGKTKARIPLKKAFID